MVSLQRHHARDNVGVAYTFFEPQSLRLALLFWLIMCKPQQEKNETDQFPLMTNNQNAGNARDFSIGLA
ncbi:hypothetical protein [Noviherbaspirillum soli]|uniref:hypothetical protein n=1 Tax=Noviherbaspirillum soli TaxID=1064518 RepID=UPI00188CACE1|nr:hypothetical protein [Noviherbaspirillum soli]